MAAQKGRRHGGLDPVVWTPPERSERAKKRTSDTQFEVEIIRLPSPPGDDVLVADDGSLYTGVADGRILRLWPDGRAVFDVASTGGRPLGLDWHPDGDLIVADCERGLLKVHLADKSVEVLVGSINGVGMKLLNKCVVASDGTIYFTDSSLRFKIDDFKADLLEHSSTGRLFRRLPGGRVEILLEHLGFANGVALSADESYLVFAQSSMYSLEKLWLTGPNAGQREPFVDNLPAFPDGVALGTDGLFWVALPSARNPMLDYLSPRSPALRKLAWAMPAPLQPRDSRTLFTQAYDADGTLVHDLQKPHPELYFCSGVAEHRGVVWLGSLSCPAIGRMVL